MKITKAGQGISSGTADVGELELINRFARARLEPEQVYIFSLALCDNEIDRDNERFDEKTLMELSELFTGRTGISDHRWESAGQVARIYRTEYVVQEERKTADGRVYACVKAWAYMLRTAANEQLIAEIEGGIKRETSIGCAVGERVCSICGRSMGDAECGHVPGREYGGKKCHCILRGAVDAYEWSFVAVPAQRNAGVTKALGNSGTETQESLKELAELGRQYISELRGEVMRLGLICDRGVYKAMGPALEHMDACALRQMRTALEKKCATLLPIETQLGSSPDDGDFDGSQFII